MALWSPRHSIPKRGAAISETASPHGGPHDDSGYGNADPATENRGDYLAEHGRGEIGFTADGIDGSHGTWEVMLGIVAGVVSVIVVAAVLVVVYLGSTRRLWGVPEHWGVTGTSRRAVELAPKRGQRGHRCSRWRGGSDRRGGGGWAWFVAKLLSRVQDAVVRGLVLRKQLVIFVEILLLNG
jgi:hypothetical protein